MGRDKASLPFGNETLLQRVARLLSSTVSTLVIVSSDRTRKLPPIDLTQLESNVTFAFDETEGNGPLQGMLAGFSSLPKDLQSVFVTGCDVPFLSPNLVEFLFQKLERSDPLDIILPVEKEFDHVLSAVYRTSVTATIQNMVNAKRWRPLFVTEFHRTLKIPVSTLRSIDPELSSFLNLNSPESYLQALTVAGFKSQAIRQAKEFGVPYRPDES